MTGVIWTNALITVSAFTFIWPLLFVTHWVKSQLVCTTLFLWSISFQNTVHWIKCIPGIFYCQWCTPPEFYILILSVYTLDKMHSWHILLLQSMVYTTRILYTDIIGFTSSWRAICYVSLPQCKLSLSKCNFDVTISKVKKPWYLHGWI